jgi:hypothetical protein
MSAVLQPFPDAELILVAGLSPVLQQIYGDNGVRVVTILPATITIPTVRVKRISGANRDIILDRPILDVDVFASTEGTSSAIARQILASLYGLRGRSLANGVITNVNVVQGPRWLPEPNPNLFRYNASYEVFTHS